MKKAKVRVQQFPSGEISCHSRIFAVPNSVGTCLAARDYSAIISPEPPSSAGKSFSFGKPSRTGSTVSA